MNMYLLFLIALIPIVGLMISLGVLKIAAYKAVPSTLAVTILLAILVWKMPMISAVTATLEGAAMAHYSCNNSSCFYLQFISIYK
jgi:lactate permease